MLSTFRFCISIMHKNSLALLLHQLWHLCATLNFCRNAQIREVGHLQKVNHSDFTVNGPGQSFLALSCIANEVGLLTQFLCTILCEPFFGKF